MKTANTANSLRNIRDCIPPMSIDIGAGKIGKHGGARQEATTLAAIYIGHIDIGY
ncbi:MAG: hypothetical protein JNK48_00975 [Bryobacterales bacterium]|nr:hypothetical protein [Bryobacterales bacterium]